MTIEKQTNRLIELTQEFTWLQLRAHHRYDVFPDGSFLMLKDEGPPAAPRIEVVVNWVAAKRNEERRTTNENNEPAAGQPTRGRAIQSSP